MTYKLPWKGVPLLFLVGTVFLLSCHRGDNAIVATVDNDVIRAGDVKLYQDYLKTLGSSAPSTTRRQILDILILTSARRSLLKKNGWDTDPLYQNFLKAEGLYAPKIRQATEESLLMSLLFRKFVKTEARPTDLRIRDYFNANRAPYAGKSVYQLSKIVCPDEVSAHLAEQSLLDGRPFADVARKLSSDRKTAAEGGHVPPVLDDMLDPSIAAQVPTRNVGMILPIVRTAEGYALWKIEAKRPAGYEDLKDQIASDVKFSDYTEWVQKQKSAMRIQVNEAVLDKIKLDQ